VKGFFLDENLPPRVADLLATGDPPVPAVSVFEWEEGRLLNTADERILEAIVPHSLILITYDRTSIDPLLRRWGDAGLDHSGVVFIIQSSIRSSDFGGLCRALTDLWRDEGEFDWTNRVRYLRPPALT